MPNTFSFEDAQTPVAKQSFSFEDAVAPAKNGPNTVPNSFAPDAAPSRSFAMDASADPYQAADMPVQGSDAPAIAASTPSRSVLADPYQAADMPNQGSGIIASAIAQKPSVDKVDAGSGVQTAPPTSTLKTIGANMIGAAIGQIMGAIATGAHYAGADDTAKEYDEGRAQVHAAMKQQGGDSFIGKASGLFGSIATVLAVPEDLVSQMFANGAIFAVPAYRDTYKEQIAAGASETVAQAHAIFAGSVNLLMPTVAARGMGAVAKQLGTNSMLGVKGAAAGIGQAAVEGAGFSAINSVGDKAIDVAAGRKNDKDWIDLEDMAVNATVFGGMRVAHRIKNGEPVHNEIADAISSTDLNPGGVDAEALARLDPQNYRASTIDPKQTVKPYEAPADLPPPAPGVTRIYIPGTNSEKIEPTLNAAEDTAPSAADERASALQRLAVLNRKAQGTPDSIRIDDDGKKIAVRGDQPEILTGDENRERNALLTKFGPDQAPPAAAVQTLEQQLAALQAQKNATIEQSRAPADVDPNQVTTQIYSTKGQADEVKAVTEAPTIEDAVAQANALVDAPVKLAELTPADVDPNQVTTQIYSTKGQADELQQKAKSQAQEPLTQQEAATPAAEGAQTTYVKGTVTELPVAGLSLSKDVPQFKEGADSKGVTPESKLNGGFDRALAAPIQVWQRLDGSMEVISGRHRLDLAQRSGETTMPAQVHREADGFDANQARVLDIELNVKDGRGKVKDYVNYFKEFKPTREQATADGLLNTAVGRSAFTIADSGGESLIASHANNAISDEAAVKIAQAAPGNEAMQGVALTHLRDGSTTAQAIATMQAAKLIHAERGRSDETLDMFGNDTSMVDQAKAMGKEVARQQNEIDQRLRAISGAARNPVVARQEGIDVRDPVAVQNRIAELKNERAQWDRWSTDPDMVARVRDAISPEAKQEPRLPAKPVAPEAPELSLTGETAAEARARLAAEDQRAKDAQNEAQRLAAAERAAQVKKDIDARQNASAENFELGQTAQESLSGQKDIFGNPQEPAAADPIEDHAANKQELRAKADLQNALADLADIFGAKFKANMVTPEQEHRLVPVLTRVLDAAFRLGYVKFKDASKFALDQIRKSLGGEVADAITLDHLQGSYIAMAGGKKGVDTKRSVIDIENKSEIEGHTAQTEKDRAAESKPEPKSEPQTLRATLEKAIADGAMPKDNPALRKIVEQADGKSASTARMKEAQETLEAAIAQHARGIVDAKTGMQDTFEKLVGLYNSQPNMNIRTSTSIENQAYSTPAPLAYLASELARITHKTTVEEPTAGTGLLLIGTDPSKVVVNELNSYRAALLREQGYTVTERDATEGRLSGDNKVDRVITNPPFGSIKDAAGNPIKVKVDGYSLGQIDHLIAARALADMKDNGAATLIIGANKVAGGISNSDLIFFNWLYSHYNVTSHFEVDGDLYQRQGAGWPVRVITINGREASGKYSPATGTIERASNWKEVYEQFNKGMDAGRTGNKVAENSSVRDSVVEAKPVAVPQPDGAKTGGTDRVRPEGGAGGDGVVAGASAGIVGNRGAKPDTGLGSTDTTKRPDVPANANNQLGQTGNADASRPAKPAGDSGTDSLTPTGNEYQVPYIARSERKDEGVLIPVNMARPTQDALSALEDSVGNIDDYAAQQLGYESTEALHDAFMGLQVDSVASSIHQISKGKGVIIADQTGIGKGRQAAGIIRWAQKEGHIPIFITVKPSLFTDMHGDLHDIGTDNIAPFIMNVDESIKGEDGGKLFVNNKLKHRGNIDRIAESGELPEGSNAVFMTYSQINTANAQRRAILALAPKAVFILDESHNAGGESATGEFVQQALGLSKGVTYLSATYAKRPDNMPLYFMTDIGEAISDNGALMEAMASGGLPLQTVVSNNLVAAGQMFRRERSYDGVSIETRSDTERRIEHEKISNAATSALRAIVAADKQFHEGYVANAKDEAEQAGGRIHDNSGNQAGESVNHTEFSSVVHNFVRQMLLGLKAQTAADEAIASIRRGEKPLIALENTMGSFLSEYAENNNLKAGDSLGNFDYRTVLSRALERTRYLTRQLPNGDKVKEFIKLSDLDPATREAYVKTQELIDGLQMDIPVSPLDWMRSEIQRAGHSVAEITGRDLAVDYSDPKNPVLSSIDPLEQKDKVNTTRRFNNGQLDSIILNVAGSTGISLHSSERFADQRQRHMVVAQAAQDINIFMQMLGRIHRTGQVNLPKYTILNVDLPAEKRPTAILSGKMKSLNANTSSNTESATSVKSSDMLNKYGDQIVSQYLQDNPDLRRALNVDAISADGEPEDGIARKATGRLALMPVEVQNRFYSDVEGQYQALIEYLNKTNQNELEPRTVDYDAKELKQSTLFEGENKDSPFGSDAIYGEYSVKAQGKAMTPDEIQSSMAENLGGMTPKAHSDAMIASGMDDLKKLTSGMDDPDRVENEMQVARSTRQFLDSHKIGSAFRVEINGDVYNAVVTNLRSTHKENGNPFSLSKIQVSVSVNGALRNLSIPATQFRRIEVSALGRADIRSLFEAQPGNQREVAKIITGNLLAAYGELKGTRGTIISFTKGDGTSEQGILLPKSFNYERNTAGDYRLKSAEDAYHFLMNGQDQNLIRFGIATRDGIVRVTPAGDSIIIQVPKSKAKGGKYFLDDGLRAIVGDFVSSGQFMKATASRTEAGPALDLLMRKQALYAAPSMAEEAKGMAKSEGIEFNDLSSRKQTDTPEFKKWFGDSKVVDPDGKPLVVYHGTSSGKFDTFDIGRAGTSTDDGYYGRGFYFSSHEGIAKNYAGEGDSSHVMGVHLSLKNPLVFNRGDNRTDILQSLRGWNARELALIKGGDARIGEDIESKRFTEILRQNGHDGVIVNSWKLGKDANGNVVGVDAPMHEVIALDADQIKSATGNNGNFDPSDANILHDRTTPEEARTAATSRAVDAAIARSQGLDAAEVTPMARTSALLKLRQAFSRMDGTGADATPEMFVKRVGDLLERLEAKTADKSAARDFAERQRGADFLREKILSAKRRGDILPETADMADWFIRQNPALVSELGISIKSFTGEGTSPAGQYNPFAKVMTLFKGATNDGTAVHEILHHLERLMPPDMQKAIRDEYIKQVGKIMADKTTTPETKAYLEAALKSYATGNRAEQQKAADLLSKAAEGSYQFMNPSEFWAVNATRLMESRYNAQGGAWAKIGDWLSNTVQHVRGALGMASDAPILRALKDVMAGRDGTIDPKSKMLAQRDKFSDPSKAKDRADSDVPHIADFTKKDLGPNKSSYTWSDGENSIIVGFSRTEDHQISNDLDVWSSDNSNGLKGKGIATSLFLSGLEDFSKKFPRAGFRSETILSDESIRLYERLTDAGLPFYKDGRAYILDNYAIRSADFDAIRDALASNSKFKFSDLSDIVGKVANGYSAYGGIEVKERERSGTIGDDITRALQPTARDGAVQTAGIIRSNLAEQAHGRELAQQRLVEFAKQFDKMPVADNYAFIDRMERGIPQTDPELSRAAAALRRVLDERRDQVIALGKGSLENFNENYFPHIWDDPKGLGAAMSRLVSRRPLEGGKGFLKQRTYDFFQDAIDAGFKPVTTNPVELTMLKAREMDRYIYAQRIFGEMKDANIAKFVRFGDRAPDGWIKINDNIARVMQYSDVEKGMILRGEYYAPEQAGTIINNHLSPGLSGNGAYDMIRRAGNTMNAAQLGLSAFHLGFTTLDAMISKAALGIKQASRGDIVPGVLNVAQSVNPVQPILNLMKGDKLLKAYMGDISDPSMAPIVEALLEGGGRVKMDDMYRNQGINEFRQALRKGEYGSAAMKVLPRLIDLINKPIFEYLVPRQKLGVFSDMAKDALAANPGMDIETKREVMGKLWDSVDNRMGELVYDNVFWHRAMKDALMVSTRSVGWNLGTFREIGGGAKDLVQGGMMNMTDRSSYMFGLAFVTAIIGSLTQYLMTGEGPKELKDVFFPRTGKERPDGTLDRLSLPSYMKDIAEYSHDIHGFIKFGDNPLNTIKNKMHPLISTLGQIIDNKDFFGGAIRSPGDSSTQQAMDYADYMLKQFTPFGLRNYTQQSRLAGKEPTVLGYVASPAFIGITPAPGYITKDEEQSESSQVAKMRESLMMKFKELMRDGADWGEINERAKDAGLSQQDRAMIRRYAEQRPPRHLKAFGN